MMLSVGFFFDGCCVGSGFCDVFWGDVLSLFLLDDVIGVVFIYFINVDVYSVWLNFVVLVWEGFCSLDGMLCEEDVFEIFCCLNVVDFEYGDCVVWCVGE